MIFIIDPSKRCEPSAFLFTKAVNFFLVNGYHMANDIDHCETVLVNTCCVTEDKIAASKAALDFARARGKGRRIVLFGCMASLPLPRVERLRSYRIEAIKVHLPLQFIGDSDLARRLGEALRRVTSVSVWGLPIHLYVPMDRMGEFHAAFATSIHQFGAERLYRFARDPDHPLVNSVACFGRGLERVRLLWVQKENPAAYPA